MIVNTIRVLHGGTAWKNPRRTSKVTLEIIFGIKIASPSDDAAGTGVAMKFGAQINRIQAAKDNVGNAISFSQTQDGFLDKIGNALDRMSELAVLAQDETKTDQIELSTRYNTLT